MAGTFAPSASLRGLAWGIDGLSLVTAGALLTLVFYRKGDDLVASGFLVFTVGESMIPRAQLWTYPQVFRPLEQGVACGRWPLRSSVFRTPFLSSCDYSGLAHLSYSRRRHCKSSRVFRSIPLRPLCRSLPILSSLRPFSDGFGRS